MIDPISGERLSDERLCWLAVRDQLQRRTPTRAARTGFGEVFALLPRIWTRLLMPEVSRDMRSERMAELALVVDDLSRRLAPDERKVLRQTGEVPDWFLPTVKASYERA